MTEQPKDGGPAFPVHGGHHPDDDPRNQILGGGMSLRDWVMGQCIAAAFGAGGNDPLIKLPEETHADALRRYWLDVAEAAAIAADAMLEARRK